MKQILMLFIGMWLAFAQVAYASAPTLKSPNNGVKVDQSSNAPCFSWNAVPGAQRYTITVNYDGDFPKMRWAGPTNLTATSYCWNRGSGWSSKGTSPTPVPSQFTPNTTYSWRVGAVMSDGWYPSVTRTFKVKWGTPIAPPNFNAPATDADGNFTLTWSPSNEGTNKYYIYENGNYIGVSYTTQRGINNKPGGSYRYKVRAKNVDNKYSAYTPEKTVVVTIPPAMPSLRLPTDGDQLAPEAPQFKIASSQANVEYIIAISKTPRGGSEDQFINYWTSGRLSGSAVTNGYTWSSNWSEKARSCYSCETNIVSTSSPAKLERGQTYYWHVVAVSSVGITKSAQHSFTVPVLPPPVPGAWSKCPAQQILRKSYVNLTHGYSAGTSSYEVQRKVDNGAWSLFTTETGSAVGNFRYDVVEGARNGYRVRACHGASCSTYSPECHIDVIARPSVPWFNQPTPDADGVYTVYVDVSANAYSANQTYDAVMVNLTERNLDTNEVKTFKNHVQSSGTRVQFKFNQGNALYEYSAALIGRNWGMVSVADFYGYESGLARFTVAVPNTPPAPADVGVFTPSGQAVPYINDKLQPEEENYILKWHAPTGVQRFFLDYQDRSTDANIAQADMPWLGVGQREYSATHSQKPVFQHTHSERRYRMQACNNGACAEARISPWVRVEMPDTQVFTEGQERLEFFQAGSALSAETNWAAFIQGLCVIPLAGEFCTDGKHNMRVNFQHSTDKAFLYMDNQYLEQADIAEIGSFRLSQFNSDGSGSVEEDFKVSTEKRVLTVRMGTQDGPTAFVKTIQGYHQTVGGLSIPGCSLDNGVTECTSSISWTRSNDLFDTCLQRGLGSTFSDVQCWNAGATSGNVDVLLTASPDSFRLVSFEGAGVGQSHNTEVVLQRYDSVAANYDGVEMSATPPVCDIVAPNINCTVRLSWSVSSLNNACLFNKDNEFLGCSPDGYLDVLVNRNGNIFFLRENSDATSPIFGATTAFGQYKATGRIEIQSSSPNPCSPAPGEARCNVDAIMYHSYAERGYGTGSATLYHNGVRSTTMGISGRTEVARAQYLFVEPNGSLWELRAGDQVLDSVYLTQSTFNSNGYEFHLTDSTCTIPLLGSHFASYCELPVSWTIPDGASAYIYWDDITYGAANAATFNTGDWKVKAGINFMHMHATEDFNTPKLAQIAAYGIYEQVSLLQAIDTDCTIATNASTCPVTIEWLSNYAGEASLYMDGTLLRNQTLNQDDYNSARFGGRVQFQITEGDHTVELRQGATVLRTVNVVGYAANVSDPNTPPVFTSTALTSVVAGNTYDYTLLASDDDNDTLMYALVSGPTGMTLSANQLVWATTLENVGAHDVVVSVSDGTDIVNQAFTLTVANNNNSNVKPVITGHQNINLQKNQIFELALNHFTINDPDQTAGEPHHIIVQDGVGYTHSGNTLIPTENSVLLNVVVVDQGGLLSDVYTITLPVATLADDYAPMVAPAVVHVEQIPPTPQAVGSVNGNFNVNESGNATYSIPIKTALASGGMSPSVSLSYSSGNQVTGLVGVGWNLAVLSSIGRCAKSYELDGVPNSVVKFNNQDELCLDGARLILTSGTHMQDGATYSPRLSSSMRVTINGSDVYGPKQFTVQAKDGMETIYGGTEVSVLRSNAPTQYASQYGHTRNERISWYRSSVSDSSINGNTITYNYDNDYEDGQILLTDIHYPPGNKIHFEYGSLQVNEKHIGYSNGAKFTSSKRLKRIDSYSGNTLLRSYQLQYVLAMPGFSGYASGINNVSIEGTNYLKSIKECVDVDGTQCLSPTTFTWSEKAGKTFEPQGWVNNRWAGAYTSSDETPINVIDLNADGYADLFYYNGTSKKIEARYGYGNGEFGVDIEVADVDLSGMLSESGRVSNRYADRVDAKFFKTLKVVDVDGDGYPEIFYMEHYSSSSCKVRFNPQWENTMAACLQQYENEGAYCNFLIDSAWGKEPENCQLDHNYEWMMVRNGPQGFSMPEALQVYIDDIAFDKPVDAIKYAGMTKIADITGDGLPDILVRRSNQFDMYLNHRTHYSTIAQTVAVTGDVDNLKKFGNEKYAEMDYDRDGRIDFIYQGEDDEWRVLMSREHQPGVYSFESVLLFGNGASQIDMIVTPDINGDGWPDMVHMDIEEDENYRPRLDWYYRLNKGYWDLAPTRLGLGLEQAQFVDINEDGFADHVHIHEGALKFRLFGSAPLSSWEVQGSQYVGAHGDMYSGPDDEYNTSQHLVQGSDHWLHTGIGGEGRHFIFTDVTGDGAVDFVRIVWVDNGSDPKHWSIQTQRNVSGISGDKRQWVQRVIKRIDNGLGNKMEIEYLPMHDRTVYQSDGGAELLTDYGRGSTVFDVKGGASFLVSKVASSLPTAGNPNNTASVSYFYKNMRMQSGGRGSLGFEVLQTTDNQTGVVTETTYRQDAPFEGYPAKTVVKKSDGTIIKHAVNYWAVKTEYDAGTTTTGDDVIKPYLAANQENVFDLNGFVISSTATSTDYGDYGNVSKTQISIYDNHDDHIDVDADYQHVGMGLQSRMTTDNLYYDDESRWYLGRLINTKVAHYRPNASGPTQQTKESSFKYDPVTGLLKTTIVEPGGSADIQLITTLKRDDFGNIIKSTICSNHIDVDNCGTSMQQQNEDPQSVNDPLFINQSSRMEISADGVHTQASFNLYNQEISRILTRNDLGQPTLETALSGMETTTAYDAFGAAYFTRTNTGGWTQTINERCGNDYCGFPPAIIKTITTGPGPKRIVYSDALGRTVATQTQSFDELNYITQQTVYNESGYITKTSSPYFSTEGSSGFPQYWSVNEEFDELGVPHKVTAPNDMVTRVSYNGYTTTTTIDDGITPQTKTEVNDALGQTTSVTDALGGVIRYQYDVFGNLRNMSHNDVWQSTINYDAYGRKIGMQDANQGGLSSPWSYQYNAAGQLYEQRDAKGQIVRTYYDAMGRHYRRDDIDTNAVMVSSSRWVYNNAPGRGFGAGQVQTETLSISGHVHKAMTYDKFNRNTKVDTTIDETAYQQRTTYDQLGRVFQQFDVAGHNSGVRFKYNDLGLITHVYDARGDDSTAQRYRQVLEMNEHGQVSKEQIGNVGSHLNVTKTYYPKTGLLKSIDTINPRVSGDMAKVQDLDYQYDDYGNVTYRGDLSAGKELHEIFTYDALNRLTHINGMVEATYAANGNILTKRNGSVMDNYVYGTQEADCTITAGLHAVTKFNADTFCYDVNGNQISGASRTIRYSTFNKPLNISKAGHTTEFAYGAGRDRYKRIDIKNDQTSTTYYIGGVEVIHQAGSSQVEYRRAVAGVLVSEYRMANGNTARPRKTRFALLDHIGSTDVVTDHLGNIEQVFSFDAWGKQRDPSTWSQYNVNDSALVLLSPQINALYRNDTAQPDSLTLKGFTGHEQLTEVGLIHMNGRIYDPVLARFVQADPFIQAPTNSQSLNRYTYVMNNPLTYTDPSGHFFMGGTIGFISQAWMAQKLSRAVLKAVPYKVGSFLVSIGSAFCGPWAPACAAVGNYDNMRAHGYSVKEARSGGVRAGVSTYVFQQIGNQFSYENCNTCYTDVVKNEAGEFLKGKLTTAALTKKITYHALAGGVLSELQGGKFGHGFSSALVGQGFGAIKNHYGNTWNWNRVFVTSLVGGLSSKISGGKFRSGFEFSLGTSLLTLGNYVMRKQVIANSALRFYNISGKSAGLFGDGFKAAGARRELLTLSVLGIKISLPVLPCDSLMGGCQGAPMLSGDTRSSFFGLEYDPGSVPDYINESFAGPHDWLRNLTGSYDSYGNSRSFSGMASLWDTVKNYALVIPAAPFAFGAIAGQSSSFQSAFILGKYGR